MSDSDIGFSTPAFSYQVVCLPDRTQTRTLTHTMTLTDPTFIHSALPIHIMDLSSPISPLHPQSPTSHSIRLKSIFIGFMPRQSSHSLILPSAGIPYTSNYLPQASHRRRRVALDRTLTRLHHRPSPTGSHSSRRTTSQSPSPRPYPQHHHQHVIQHHHSQSNVQPFQ